MLVGTATPFALKLVDPSRLSAIVGGKNILFAVHGFNVNREDGAASLAQIEPQLALTSSDLFIAVLWPGDFWGVMVDYPFEGQPAMDCGRRLAAFCNTTLSTAQSFSFMSHSLGARLVLEAVNGLERPARLLCLTAGAINRDCLVTQYAQASTNAATIAILASQSDHVLQLAFPIGDPLADLLHDDHALFTAALGYAGPPVPAAPPVEAPWQISKNDDYDHGDYLPPVEIVQNAPGADPPKWLRVAGFVANAYRGRPQPWP
jgi:hypothetical protein